MNLFRRLFGRTHNPDIDSVQIKKAKQYAMIFDEIGPELLAAFRRTGPMPLNNFALRSQRVPVTLLGLDLREFLLRVMTRLVP